MDIIHGKMIPKNSKSNMDEEMWKKNYYQNLSSKALIPICQIIYLVVLNT